MTASFKGKCLLAGSILVEHIPDNVPIQADLGFKGLEAEYENIHLLYKKPRGGQLTDDQKGENKVFNGESIVVEYLQWHQALQSSGRRLPKPQTRLR